MKNRLLLLGSVLLTFSQAYSQDTIYSIAYSQDRFRFFDFENSDSARYFLADSSQLNNIWQIGTPQKAVFDNAYSPTRALITDSLNPYPINNTSSFTITIKSDDATFIDFWHRFNTDSLSDGGVIEISKDGGTTWTNVIDAGFYLQNLYSETSFISSNNNKPGFTGNSGWVQSEIRGYTFDFWQFRFTFTSDNINTSKDGWEIDNFSVDCEGTGIGSIGTNSLLHIYPNPATDFTEIIRPSSNSQNFSLKVFDVLGNEINVPVFGSQRSFKLDLSSLSSGIYFVQVNSDNKILTEKFSKK